jgi:hypothetical protein
MTLIVNCPTCGARVEWKASNAFKPFCSERCKLIDLGEWASENYRVASEDSASADHDPDLRHLNTEHR